MHEASAFWAYPIPPYPGTSMFPQAPKAVELSIHKVISIIYVPATPAWASLELKVNSFLYPPFYPIAPIPYNIIISYFFLFAHTFLQICLRLKQRISRCSAYKPGWRCDSLSFQHPFCHVHATVLKPRWVSIQIVSCSCSHCCHIIELIHRDNGWLEIPTTIQSMAETLKCHNLIGSTLFRVISTWYFKHFRIIMHSIKHDKI